MNTQSTLKIGTKAQTDFTTLNPGNLLRDFANSSWISRLEKSIKSIKDSTRTAPDYRLGEAVHHGSFGTGRVMSHWPDGRLVVRFDNAVKNRLIFPSLLNRVNGQWR